MELRNFFEEPYGQMKELLKTNDNCQLLFQAFCGTGKSRVVAKTIVESTEKLIVVVFPTLALIRQFYDDYVIKEEKGIFSNGNREIQVICSEKKTETDETLKNIKFTTEKLKTKLFSIKLNI